MVRSQSGRRRSPRIFSMAAKEIGAVDWAKNSGLLVKDRIAGRPGIEAHFVLEHDGHAADFTQDGAVANGLRFAGIVDEIVERQTRVEIHFPGA